MAVQMLICATAILCCMLIVNCYNCYPVLHVQMLSCAQPRRPQPCHAMHRLQKQSCINHAMHTTIGMHTTTPCTGCRSRAVSTMPCTQPRHAQVAEAELYQPCHAHNHAMHRLQKQSCINHAMHTTTPCTGCRSRAISAALCSVKALCSAKAFATACEHFTEGIMPTHPGAAEQPRDCAHESL